MVRCWPGYVAFKLFLKLKFGRKLFDRFKLNFPILGPVVSKVAISRFARTLGTLVSSGVPILQALTIVRETSGNVIVSNAVASVHESVKEGETITAPLDESKVFPPMVISMVDVGEQTGALPEMLMKIADTYDDEVDNAVAAMTSLLEPIMIVVPRRHRRQHRHRFVPPAHHPDRSIGRYRRRLRRRLNSFSGDHPRGRQNVDPALSWFPEMSLGRGGRPARKATERQVLSI
jgi:hypothetical protein